MSDTAINKIIQYGTAAARAAYTPTPPAGIQTLYIWFDTDASPNTYVWNGAAWVQINTTISGASTRTFGITIDGGGVVPSTGVKGDVLIPIACTISRVTMLADTTGNAVVDIWKDTYANFPPTVADTITSTAKPTITAALKSLDTTLTGWVTTIAANDILRFNLDSISTITRLQLQVTVTT